MEDQRNSVPYIVYEGALVRHERLVKRLVITLIIAVVLMFLSNMAWLYAWQQYDYIGEEITYSQDGQGLNNINTGMQGGVRYEPDIYGEETSKNKEE